MRKRQAPGEDARLIIIHPPAHGHWPDGEPQSVRDAADARTEQRKTGKER